MTGTNNILVAVPCRDMMPTATAKSIAATVKAGFDVVFSTGGGLPNARNEIARNSLHYAGVLMVDSDMVWLPEHIFELVRVASEKDLSIVSGRYYSRSTPHQAHAYKDGRSFHGGQNPLKDQIFEVDYTGAGFLLINKYVWPHIKEPWFDHSYKQGEDAYFCHKAKAAGIPTYLYPFVTVGHVGTTMFSDPQYDRVVGG